MPVIFCLLFLLLLLCFPELCVRGAANGLSLWLFTLVPTFFPFLFLSNLMVSCGAADEISRFCGRIFCPLFRVSASGAYILFMGFLSGYPMGAKLSAEFVKSGRISHEEGNRLLAFSNHPSPMFLAGFIFSDCMREPYSKIGTIAMFYVAPILTGLMLSRLRAGRSPQLSAEKATPSDRIPGTVTRLDMNLIRTSMSDAFVTLVYLGGYVLLFHIGSALILALAGHFSADVYPLFCLLAAFLEMSGGAALLAASDMPAVFVNLFVPLCVISGGFCILAQTAGLLSGSGLSIRPYIRGKLLQTVLAAGIYLLWFFLV